MTAPHGLNVEYMIDALSGAEVTLRTCPICGYQEREQGGECDILEYGNTPSPEDAARFKVMAKTPEGRRELSSILRQFAGHVWTEIDQAEMERIAKESGVEGSGSSLVLGFSPLVLTRGR